MTKKRVGWGWIGVLVACGAVAQAQDRANSLAALNESLEQLTLRVNPCVVQVFVIGYAPIQDGTFSGAGLAKQRSGGSGVLVDPDGYIVTNFHVVEDAIRIQVRLPPPPRDEDPRRSLIRTPTQTLGAQLIGFDRETDLAVLKIEKSGLPFLPFGDSDKLSQGQFVMAFGSPRGLENSVSLGVVSAKARQLQPDAPMVYIQTDAPINPGNSGGPLVNVQGEVVGINTFIFSHSGGNEGLGFAAPSNIVKHVYHQIRQHRRVRRGIIGVNAQTITPALSQGLGLNRDWGVILGDVLPGSPASQAGLKAGDIVLALNGKTMENGRQFDVNLYRIAVDEWVEIEVLRGTAARKFQVRVIERPDDLERFSELANPQDNLIPNLGILAIEITPEIAALLGPPRKLGGVLVAARSVDAPFSDGGLMPGDIIFQLNGRAVNSLKKLRLDASNLPSNSPVVLQVQRQGQLHFVAFLKQ
ncbi:MAG: trypsin-like peptidase domain-containing protein [Acidobacteriota bacterium]